MFPLVWHTGPKHEFATVVIGGLIAIRVRAYKDRFDLEGSDGRRHQGGPCLHIPGAKKAALEAIKAILEAGVGDMRAELIRL